VITVRCVNVDPTAEAAAEAVGTGFVTARGVITASHVIAPCAYSGPGSVSAGPFVVSVSRNDPAHDLAVIAVGDAGRPLSLDDALPSASDRLELLGLAHSTDNAVPTGVVTSLAGTVVDNHATVTLQGENGSQETLTDAIVVDAPGVIPGDSGGPAIDATGRVVGVVEGSGDGRAYLTPVTDVPALTS
jgi:S1-C subfamily serine protease